MCISRALFVFLSLPGYNSRAWSIWGSSIVLKAARRRWSACRHPAWWGCRGPEPASQPPALSSSWSWRSLRRAAAGSWCTPCSYQRCPLWLVGFGLMPPVSRHTGWWRGRGWVSALPPPRPGPVCSSSVAQKPCSSPAPTLCIFCSTRFLVCPGWPPPPTGACQDTQGKCGGR